MTCTKNPNFKFPGDTDANQTWEYLQTLLRTRIQEGLAGIVSTKFIDEILNEELAEDWA